MNEAQAAKCNKCLDRYGFVNLCLCDLDNDVDYETEEADRQP